MTLPTDQLVAKAYTGTTMSTLSAIIPALWASQMETNLRRRSVLLGAVVENTDLLVPNSGDRVYIPGLPDLGAAVALTEGTAMTINALSAADAVVLTPTEYGNTISITRKALDRIKYDGMTAIMERLAYSMAILLENKIAALYNATTAGLPHSQQPFGNNTLVTSLPTYYPNGHATGTIVATDLLSAGSLRNALAKLQQYDVLPMSDGNFWLFMSPDSFAGLLADSTVLTDIRYGAPSDIMAGFNGFTAHIYGINIIVTNYIVSATENGIPVNNNLLVTDRWATIAWKRRPELVVDPTLYDMGRERRFGVTADFDVELLHAERAMVLKCAKQF